MAKPPPAIGSLEAEIALWTTREAELRRRADAGKGQSARAWQKAQRLAVKIGDLRAGHLDKLALARFLGLVDDLCEVVSTGADREQAWAEQEKCSRVLQGLKRERRTAIREEQARVLTLLRRRLIDRPTAKTMVGTLIP